MGKVDQTMLAEFFRQQNEAPADMPLVIELSTSGGDADIGRRIAHEVRDWWQQGGSTVYFLGKTFVYSAGVTIMAAVPQRHRFLTDDCELLIHERKISKTLNLSGALRGCRSVVQDVLAEIDSGQRLERAGFIELVDGSRLSIDDLMHKVLERDWYLTAHDALRSGLVAGIC